MKNLLQTSMMGAFFHSVHMEKSHFGKTGEVTYCCTTGNCLSMVPQGDKNSFEQLQVSEHAPRQSLPLGQ